MTLSVLSFSVSHLQNSLLGVTPLQPSWADQPWPYKFSVSPTLGACSDWFRELNPAVVLLEGG
jgi:hypothetical protein